MNLPPRVSGPAAWSADDLGKRKQWRFQLSDVERAEIIGATEALIADGSDVADVTSDRFAIPQTVNTLLRAAEETEEGSGVALVRGLPVDPADEQSAALMYAGVTAHLGEKIVQDTAGTLIDRVEDRGLSYDSIHVRGYTTNAPLTPHCDSGDLLTLLCVRPAASGGVNLLSSSVSIYNKILDSRPDLIEPLLTGFHYNIRGNGPPSSVDITAHRVPVYHYMQGKLSCRFNEKAILTAPELPGVDPLTELESEAVAAVAMHSYDKDLEVRVGLDSGDMLLLSNHSVFHNREGFTDHEDPCERRLLLRSWINIPNGRPMTLEFADHYNTGPRQGPYVEGSTLSRGLAAGG